MNGMTSLEETPEQPMNPGVRWIPVEEAKAGMILARPAVKWHKRILTLKVPAGTMLTESELAQFMAHGIECIGVVDESFMDAEAVQRRSQAWERRLEAIFGGNRDSLEPERQSMFDALLQGEPWR